MKLIQKLSDMIEEEITDAWKYARCYQTYKENEPELAKTFMMLSQAELNHVDMLHAQVVRLIKEYRDKNGEPPEHMMFIYNYLHERHTNNVADIRLLLS